AVEQSLEQRRVLSLRYRDGNGRESAHRVDPVFLAHTQGQWFLVAHSREREAIRWFVLDRILIAHLTADEAVDIPVAAVGAPPATARAVTGEG
ncbi:helix-turn-helix transcriptional regulator, partial [Brevibacterium casei]|uniref:helix-turn-helix transcriptional regulator n=1 Tax=Brevibacterium casei TaxID=33889 RepID=UPI0011A02D8D